MASFPSRWAARILCRPEQAEKPYGVTTAYTDRGKSAVVIGEETELDEGGDF
jgi:hypothetical protein